MKIKRTISIAIVCVLLVTVLSAVLVYAPPPTEPTIPMVQPVLVTNTVRTPVPVEVANETLYVTLDEPIDVTLDEPIEVTNPSGEALDVEVTNTEGLALDVSGWLHTTQYGSTGWQEFPPIGEPEVLLLLDTEGYRKIDIVLSDSEEAGYIWCNCSITWYIGEGTFLTPMYEVEKWLPVVDDWCPVHLTYDVMGTHLVITMQSGGGGIGEVMATYYMTT